MFQRILQRIRHLLWSWVDDIDDLCGTKLRRNFCVQKQLGKEEDETACCTGDKDELDDGNLAQHRRQSCPGMCQSIVDVPRNHKRSR